MLEIQGWGLTDVGLKRENNQDSLLLEPKLGLFVVADGMGGHKGGEVASSMAVETVREVFLKASLDQRRPAPKLLLSEAYLRATERIFLTSQNPTVELKGMGTTLLTVYQSDQSVFVANVGDSRCYLFREDQLWQITEDHSLVNELLRGGQIAEAEVPKFVAKNVITRSVGFEAEVQPDILERELREGDHFLLCSDGLSGLVPPAELVELIRRHHHEPEKLVQSLISSAKSHGGDDNITAVFLAARQKA